MFYSDAFLKTIYCGVPDHPKIRIINIYIQLYPSTPTRVCIKRALVKELVSIRGLEVFGILSPWIQKQNNCIENRKKDQHKDILIFDQS